MVRFVHLYFADALSRSLLKQLVLCHQVVGDHLSGAPWQSEPGVRRKVGIRRYTISRERIPQ